MAGQNRSILRASGAREPSDQFDRLVSAQELADYLEIPVKTVYTWRHRNTGPRGFRVGKHLRFRWSEVERWLARLAAEDAH
jgi:excisionase family DNA binding protein